MYVRLGDRVLTKNSLITTTSVSRNTKHPGSAVSLGLEVGNLIGPKGTDITLLSSDHIDVIRVMLLI